MPLLEITITLEGASFKTFWITLIQNKNSIDRYSPQKWLFVFLGLIFLFFFHPKLRYHIRLFTQMTF